MAVQIESDSKLQFYPTHRKETLRSMCVMGGLYVDNREIAKQVIGENTYNSIYEEYVDNKDRNMSLGAFVLEHLFNHNKFTEIEDTLVHQITTPIVADLFAGEGKWLKDYRILSKKGAFLIGNELEENRYNTMVKDGLVQYHYNLPFEELQLPKHIINIMLFNPPYGITNGERNVRRYLRMILERELITDDGYIVIVAKTEDIINCSDLLVEYFEIEKMIAYKAHEEEFQKFKQQILILPKRTCVLNKDNISNVSSYKAMKEYFEDVIREESEFDFNMYYKIRWINFKNIDVIKAFEDFEYVNQNKPKLSNVKSKAMKWVIDDTIVKDLSNEIIQIPKPLKSGELANVIASGKINGEISLENDIAKHVACGGVKNTMEERQYHYKNKKGETELKKETLLKSEPYLNILINNNGKLEVKELK